MAKLAPFVGVAVWEGPPWVDGCELDRSHRLQALVRTETTARAVLMMGVDAPVEIEGERLSNVQRISKDDYLHLVETAVWATAHAPHRPEATPREAIDKRGKSIF